MKDLVKFGIFATLCGIFAACGSDSSTNANSENNSEATLSSSSEVSQSSSSEVILSSSQDQLSSSSANDIRSSSSEVILSSSQDQLSSSSSNDIRSSSSEVILSSSQDQQSSSSSNDIQSSSSEVILSSSQDQQSSSSDAEAQLSSESSIAYGSLLDTRDGNTYRTVDIGSQTWMAENLNYATSEGSWCLDDDTTNCTIYGRMYNWQTTVGKTYEECGMGKKCNLPSGNIQGICPSGWHIPSHYEIEILFSSVDSSYSILGRNQQYRYSDIASLQLKASNNLWPDSVQSLNPYGFSALPAGYRDASTPDYEYKGKKAFFWTRTEVDSDGAYCLVLLSSDGGYIDDDNKSDAKSVRCLKD